MIFDDVLSGHHLEYLHHFYIGALEYSNVNYIFAVPENFDEISKEMEWPYACHIKFYYFKKNIVSNSWKRCKLIRDLVLKYDIKHVYLVTFMSVLPWLPLFLPKKAKVSGIVYLIYLYRWKNESVIEKTFDVVKYILLSRFKQVDRVFILNDRCSARLLNRIYRTNKFLVLPDPFFVSVLSGVDNIRQDLGIEKDKIIFLHFGSLSERKGTLSILEAIIKMDFSLQRKFCFIFAGCVSPSIYFDFYSTVKKIDNSVQLFIYDKFCSYDFILNLCNSCDYILAPYSQTAQSSGIIAYAAAFRKPVIVSQEGLLGKMVRKYKLGQTLGNVSPDGIRECLQNYERLPDASHMKADQYIKENSVKNFTGIFFNHEKL